MPKVINASISSSQVPASSINAASRARCKSWLIRHVVLPIRMRMRLPLMLMPIVVIMLVLLCMNRVLEMHRVLRVLSLLDQVGRVLDVLFLEDLLIDRLVLQRLADHLLMHLLVFVNDVQERLFRFRMLAIVHGRPVDFARFNVRACNMRLLARTVLAILRRTLVGVEQDGGGLPTILLVDLLAR